MVCVSSISLAACCMDRSRFVVLKHTQPASQIPLARRQYLNGDDLTSDSVDVHYDLMLESEGGLLTFAVPEKPSTSRLTLPAIKLPLHRDVYLEYEGPVSGNRGTVMRVMAGTFALIEIAPQVSLERRFEKLTIELFPSDQEKPLRLALERLEQDKFQLTCAN